MAITGLVMIGFLLMHMYGNTKIFLGKDAFNEYSHHLRIFLEPIFPKMWFLWLFRIFMLVCILVHMYAAITLWGRAGKARAEAYKNSKFWSGPYVPFLMRWGGLTIFLFLIFHILQYTAEVVKVGYPSGAASILPADRMVAGFTQWWVVLIYAVAMAFVCFHVAHGFWSAFATLGANVSKNARKVLNICAGVIAALLFIGFMAAPVWIFATGGAIS